MHQEIDITPKNVSIPDGVTGFPPTFPVQPIVIPREFKDSNSVRLGAEYSFVVGGYGLDARLGVDFD